MKNIKLALINIKKNFQNAKELKSAFITSVIGMCINNISFVVLWYYFGKMMGNLNGWEPFDIIGSYGFSSTSFGLVCAFFYGIFNIPMYISTGNFDKYLITPKNTLVKVATSGIQTSALGDLLFGLICFIWYAIGTNFSILELLSSILLVIISSLVFLAFSLICMTISFYLMDGENVSMGLYGMFVSASLYHGGAFTGILRVIFVFIVPSLLLGALPVELIKDMSLIKIGVIVLITSGWLLLAICFFNKSLKKYESNNFFGFGG